MPPGLVVMEATVMGEKKRRTAKNKARKTMVTQQKVRATAKKGFYTEYLDARFSADDLAKERKKQLSRIAELRGRDVLVYAADARKHQPPQANAAIVYEDLIPINDQLSVLTQKSVDVILETTGGLAEVAEDIVKLLRTKFDHVGFIIPGQSKSAGTIIVMSGDDILMEPASSLGPIDAQIVRQGKAFSAHAFLEGLEKIKQEVIDTKQLNRAYIPILQSISPGEIQACENAQHFSRSLVSKWLERYKFGRWKTHTGTDQPVTDQERKDRAKEIADELSNHSRWLTHGRSLKIEHLREMGLQIVDYSENKELCEAIRRYHILLQMTFAGSIYKLFETPTSQIMLHVLVGQQKLAGLIAPQADGCDVDVECPNCKTKTKVQANLGKEQPIKPGFKPFPKDDRFSCPGCGTEHSLAELRRSIEGQTKKPIV